MLLDKIVVVNNIRYKIIFLIGHGKGGYSYLAVGDGEYRVIKKIHHEPCDYYQFGNKIEAELNDYKRLLDTGIRIPKMIAYDLEQEIIVKEYIDGPTISELIEKGESVEKYIPQVRYMAEQAKKHNLNIDYFPTNFVIVNDELYYVDYECNEYMEEWSFDVWGIKHWMK